MQAGNASAATVRGPSGAMKLAFCLFKYFPYGGLQRDFMRIAQECEARGHSIDVFTLHWEGPVPEKFNVHAVRPHRLSNHARYRAFVRAVSPMLRTGGYDAVVGFNKMPDLDVYYAADPCYEARVRRLRGPLYRLTPRYRHFSELERAVFGRSSYTHILMISEQEKANFIRLYGTPEERFHVLPPGVSRDRLAPENAAEIRMDFRRDLGIGEDERLVLLVGSGFRTKGLDRALAALAALPRGLQHRIRLIAIGQDNPRPFQRMADRLGVGEHLRLFAGRDDIPSFLLSADLLIHPAYSENTGTVLLEAMAAGLPVLTTDVCGFAHHVETARAGVVLPSPFRQEALNQAVAEMLESPRRREWSRNGLHYARTSDLYSMPEAAAEVIERSAAGHQG